MPDQPWTEDEMNAAGRRVELACERHGRSMFGEVVEFGFQPVPLNGWALAFGQVNQRRWEASDVDVTLAEAFAVGMVSGLCRGIALAEGRQGR